VPDSEEEGAAALPGGPTCAYLLDGGEGRRRAGRRRGARAALPGGPACSMEERDGGRGQEEMTGGGGRRGGRSQEEMTGGGGRGRGCREEERARGRRSGREGEDREG